MVLIIGAGLSGLLTAYRLKKQGIPFKIIEARNRVGGRIHTVYGTNQTAVEMGATWFGDQHIHLIALLKELGIDAFEQYMDGRALYQASPTSQAESIQIPSQAPNYRIAGGSSHLINQLYQALDQNDVLFNQTVKAISYDGNSIKVVAEEAFECEQLVLSIPPKLWAKRIAFEPVLDQEIIQVAEQTHTWMEDSIKLALTYERPFWQEDQLSGTLFSNSGPITEFYDHCNHKRDKYALCGFIHPYFAQLSSDERRAQVLNQVINLFGEQAAQFVDYEECLWSGEEHTYEASAGGLYPHQNNGHPIFRNSFYEEKLFISSTESAAAFPGYMDGAVYAANAIAEKLISTHNS